MANTCANITKGGIGGLIAPHPILLHTYKDHEASNLASFVTARVATYGMTILETTCVLAYAFSDDATPSSWKFLVPISGFLYHGSASVIDILKGHLWKACPQRERRYEGYDLEGSDTD